MKLLPKSSMENPIIGVGTGLLLLHNQEWLLFSKEQNGPSIYKAVLNVKPDDRQLYKTNTYGYL
jgi:hypothetical protein